MGQLSRCKSAKWKRLGFGVHNENATLLLATACGYGLAINVSQDKMQFGFQLHAAIDVILSRI